MWLSKHGGHMDTPLVWQSMLSLCCRYRGVCPPVCLDIPHMFGYPPLCLITPICLYVPCMFGCPPCLYFPHIFGCPWMFGHPDMFAHPICLAASICFETPHMFGCPHMLWPPICLDAFFVLCVALLYLCVGDPPYVWMSPICFDGKTCFLSVVLCLDAAHMFWWQNMLSFCCLWHCSQHFSACCDVLYIV